MRPLEHPDRDSLGKMTNRSCGPCALLVGGEHRLPADPCEYNGEYSAGPGCNNLRCEACGARVRSALMRPRDDVRIAALRESEDWSSLPFLEASTRWRLYACACRWWQEGSEHLLVNDQESAGDPDLPWICAGHPLPELPLILGELTISIESDWPAIVQRILDGACPRPLERYDDGPTLRLAWLYGYLRGLEVAPALSRAVGDRIGDPEDRVVGAVLYFFRRFPDADGFDRVVACAESDLAGALVMHVATKFRLCAWDVMIASMKERTDARVTDLARKIMLRPAGTNDPVKDTLERYWDEDAFRDDDFAWMTDNIVALDFAGPGRWKAILTRVLSASRKKEELAHLILLAGGAIIQSQRVPAAEIRGWMDKFGYRHEGWVLVFEQMLEDARG